MRVWQPGSHLTMERGARVADWSWRRTRRRTGVLARLTLPYKGRTALAIATLLAYTLVALARPSWITEQSKVSTIVLVALPLLWALARLVGAERYRRIVVPCAATPLVLVGIKWLIERVFQFSDCTARTIMTPRTDIVYLDMEEPLERILARIADGHLGDGGGVVRAIVGVARRGDDHHAGRHSPCSQQPGSSWPSPASPTTWNRPSASSTSRNIRRRSGTSSTTSTRMDISPRLVWEVVTPKHVGHPRANQYPDLPSIDGAVPLG